VTLVVYLIIRAFIKYDRNKEEKSQNRNPENNDLKSKKKISKEIGEYIEYEELNN
jgi:hypothetical protein